MKQLQLSVEQLKKIGFTSQFYPEVWEADVHIQEKTLYEIECLNGVFYCDPAQKVYRWYQRVTIGGACNRICLDITDAPALFATLKAFKIKHTFFVI